MALSYPANITFKHQETSSRLWAFLTIIHIKQIILIPHFFALFALNVIAAVLGLIGIFAVLFTGKYPQKFQEFIINTFHWQFRVFSYYFCLSDKYPPFALETSDYPTGISFPYQPESSRLWALLTIIPVKMIILIPNFIVLLLLEIVAGFCMLFGILGTLFMGRYPESFERAIVRFFRYGFRLNIYLMCFTDKRPPISWSE